jgi:nitroreductase
MTDVPNESILQFLNSHGSVRRYTDQPVTDEQLGRIIEIAQRAPTSSNLQAYSIIVVRDPHKKEALSVLSGNQPHVRECPVLLVFCPDLLRLRKICREAG